MLNLLIVYQLSSVPLPLPSLPLPLLSFLNVLKLRHSVHWGITPSPQKHHPLLSYQAPLKSANCPSPYF